MNALTEQIQNFDTTQIDDVVSGCVTGWHNLEKQPHSLQDGVGMSQVSRFCAPGLAALNISAQKLKSGGDLIVCGVVAKSCVPMSSDSGAWVKDPATNFAIHFVPQSIGADIIATVNDTTREQADVYAVESQAKTAIPKDQINNRQLKIPQH